MLVLNRFYILFKWFWKRSVILRYFVELLWLWLLVILLLRYFGNGVLQLARREITGLCRHGGGNPAWRGDYRSLSPWRRKSRLAGKLQVSVAMASKILPGGEITGLSPWRAKSRLAGDEQFVAMAGYVLCNTPFSQQRNIKYNISE